MELLLPIILQLAGLGVILAEIFLPSGGILSLAAGAILLYSLYIVFVEISTKAGMVFVVVDIITLPILVVLSLKLLARSPASLKKVLSREDGVFSQAPDMEKHLGLKGEALTDLRPAGMALLNGSRTDVVTRGEYIEKGAAIEVIRVTGNQIIVKKQK